MEDVDFNVDLQELPFEDKAYDFDFASHVLEHIPDDKKAISEIRRILKPNGIAVLPLPLVAETTVEYPEANPKEFYHVRTPGYDYFDRFGLYFSKIEKVYSYSLYEDRSQCPTEECFFRPSSMSAEKHLDMIPICYV